MGAAIVELGSRDRTLEEVRTEWESRVTEQLTELGLDIPDTGPASPTVRDNEQTEEWNDVFEEMTSS